MKVFGGTDDCGVENAAINRNNRQCGSRSLEVLVPVGKENAAINQETRQREVFGGTYTLWRLSKPCFVGMSTKQGKPGENIFAGPG
jgi:hypothetical protein